MTLDKVKTTISACRFTDAEKARLLQLVLNLQQNSADGLAIEISRKDSQYQSAYLISLWEQYAALFSQLKSNPAKVVANFKSLLDEKSDPLLNEDDRRYFLYLVLDFREYCSNPKNSVSRDILEKILDYEIAEFWQLPKEEIMYLLRHNAVYLISKFDLFENLKVVVYENNLNYAKDFEAIFPKLLAENQEKLAGKKVADWVKEYFNFSSPSAFRADTVQVAEFLIKNQAVKELSPETRKTLSEILKIYVWLQNPEISEDEVFDFEFSELDSKYQKSEEILKTLLAEQAQKKPDLDFNFSKSAPQAPKPPARASMSLKDDQLNIDEKLVDLKNRVN